MYIYNRWFKLIIVMVSIGMIFVLFTGCGQKDNQNSQAAGQQAGSQTRQTASNSSGKSPGGNYNQQGGMAVSVEVEAIQKGSLAGYVTITGEARPFNEVNIIPRLQETVEKVNVQIGDNVNKGDVLIKLNDEDNLIAVKRAEATLAVAQANLQEALNGTREEKLQQLKIEVNKAEANYNMAKTEYERNKELYDQNYIPKQKYEQSLYSYVSAQSNFESAKLSLKIAEAGATAEEIQSLKAQVTQAEASLESAKLNLTRTTIKAPINGIVSNVNIEVGEIAGNSSVITISQLSQIKIETYVSQSIVNKLKVGESVDVNIQALTKDFKGSIRHLSPVADKTKKSFPVEIVVDNSEQKIKAGMYAEVKLKTDEVLDKLLVSKKAIVDENGRHYIYLIEGDHAKKVLIKTGFSAGNQVVVFSGVNVGDKVVTTGKEYLNDGVKVNVVNRGDE